MGFKIWFFRSLNLILLALFYNICRTSKTVKLLFVKYVSFLTCPFILTPMFFKITFLWNRDKISNSTKSEDGYLHEFHFRDWSSHAVVVSARSLNSLFVKTKRVWNTTRNFTIDMSCDIALIPCRKIQRQI
jgi:hypothetical protein